jgi:NADH:ubiquinone oxidoreductase subunit D
MVYTQQIRILEQKLEQLTKGPFNTDNIQRMMEIQSQVKRLKRLEWEENYERVKMDEER